MKEALVKSTAILLIDCPDSRGIVAAVSEFLYRHGANILHADQHQDAESNLFLMRFQMRWRVERSDRPHRVALFVSKYDHCLVDLLYRHQNGELPCDIPLIISNHPDGRRWADFYGVPFYCTPVVPDDRVATEVRQLQLLREHRVDLVVLARYMQVLSANFLSHFPQRVINVHHSFLPAFSGARPYQRALERGVKIIGATSHYATVELDEGPIIEQDVVRLPSRRPGGPPRKGPGPGKGRAGSGGALAHRPPDLGVRPQDSRL
jgi:formyltetrahydrofolate deformylase